MNDKYHLIANRDDSTEEINKFSDSRDELLAQGRALSKDGYFVFIIDQRTNNMVEIRV